MANIKQQRKRVKITERERAENIRYKSRIKTMFRSLTVAADEDKDLAVRLSLELNSLIDKAVARGVIHANNAARKKAQVARMVETPAGGGLARGPATTESKEDRSKAERRAERNETKRAKKAEARASAKARVAAEAEAEEATAASKAEEAKVGVAPAAEDAAPEAEAEESPEAAEESTEE